MLSLILFGLVMVIIGVILVAIALLGAVVGAAGTLVSVLLYVAVGWFVVCAIYKLVLRIRDDWKDKH